jgi:hypothetical protein
MLRVLGIVIAVIVILADLADLGTRIAVRASVRLRGRLPLMSAIKAGGERWTEKLHFHFKGQLPTKAR